MSHAEDLLRMGLSVPQVIEGYEQACEKAVEILPGNILIIADLSKFFTFI